jgi:hypothetical protein
VSDLLSVWAEGQQLTVWEAAEIRRAVRVRAEHDDLVASRIQEAVALIRGTIETELFRQQAVVRTALARVA